MASCDLNHNIWAQMRHWMSVICARRWPMERMARARLLVVRDNMGSGETPLPIMLTLLPAIFVVFAVVVVP